MSLSESSKPEFEEVYRYAKDKIGYFIHKNASNYPIQLKEDIEQYCLMEVWKAYQRLDEELKTWKTFIAQRCGGAVVDFIRGGHGWEESKWACKFREEEKEDQEDPEKKSGPPAYAIRSRVTSVENDLGRNSHNSDVEKIAGVNGNYHNLIDNLEVKKVDLDLLARLASKDDSVLLVAKWLIGFSIKDMSDMSDVTRERFSQKIREFFEELDNPMNAGNKFMDQVIYALGLSDVYGTPNFCNGGGKDLDPVDIYKEEIIFDGRKYSPQLSLFPEENRKEAS